jgi:DNA-directed RNA polymerase specialized sigma24 family protein
VNRSQKLPDDFIRRHYREPATDDPIRRWLPHPEVARTICNALMAGGLPECDFEDALQDVYVKALASFREKQAAKDARIPRDLREMKGYCAAIARNHTTDTLRRAAQRERDFVGLCEQPDEHGPLDDGAERRDPVDAGRQLEELVHLFREGRMPEHGVEILEGIASGCTHQEIAEELGITDRAVEGRLGTMIRAFRKRMAQLGLLPEMDNLRLIVSRPGAIDTLRRAA